ncbi:MAG TPA: mycothiol system anti-sigma-R factor [Acidimicrobiales bacterium]|nr:mycothiol system anti-sigma-R factor [Acidimicrobiales bacterium]HLH46054.1 mycothiol system anti-sigma-R factor [Acidimicrobiales bacterium]
MSDGMVSAGGCAAGEEGSRGPGIDCDEAVHQLYHYLDGELTEERRRQIAFHLDLCEPCSAAAGFEVELRQVIANRCRDRVPDSLIRRIAEALEAERRRAGEAT